MKLEDPIIGASYDVPGTFLGVRHSDYFKVQSVVVSAGRRIVVMERAGGRGAIVVDKNGRCHRLPAMRRMAADEFQRQAVLVLEPVT